MKHVRQIDTSEEPEGRFTPEGELYLPPEDDSYSSPGGELGVPTTAGTTGRIVPPGANTVVNDSFSATPEDASPTALFISSPDFEPLGEISTVFTCLGEGRRPELRIINPPAETGSLVLIMHDPDAVNGDFVHWVLWNISPSVQTIKRDSLPQGAKQGQNSTGSTGWIPPCPPKGTGRHRYIFELYALKTKPIIPMDSDKAQILTTIEQDIIGFASLIGVVQS